MEFRAERLTVRHRLAGGRMRTAISEVGLQLASSEHALVLGWAGSGKTTLLKCLAGLIRPTEGRLWWDGQAVDALAPATRQSRQSAFGMIFQNDALFDSMTVLANVELPLLRRKVDEPEARARALEMLEKVGLLNAANAFPERLSGGMRKRAGLARALVGRPEVLFADDPLSGLDPATASEISFLVSEIASGRTLIWAAPEPPVGITFPRWLWLTEGRLTHDGPPRPDLLALDLHHPHPA